MGHDIVQKGVKMKANELRKMIAIADSEGKQHMRFDKAWLNDILDEVDTLYRLLKMRTDILKKPCKKCGYKPTTVKLARTKTP